MGTLLLCGYAIVVVLLVVDWIIFHGTGNYARSME